MNQNLDEKWKKLKHVLDNHEEFPLKYCFKFIVKAEQIDALTALFEDQEVEIRDSKNGNYKSCTFTLVMEDSDSIVEMYKRASEIEGLITL